MSKLITVLKNKNGFITLLSLVVITELIIIGIGMTDKKAASLEAYASQIIKNCENESYKPACYDKKIPKLMDKVSMEDAFKITWLVQEKDRGYRYCHVLGHELSAKEVQKDPSQWKEVISRCPSGVCSNGCIHGGFQERFRVESFSTEKEVEAIKPDLKAICEEKENWKPTGLEQASCYHALGHLTMYITSADAKKSADICKEIAIKEDGRNFLQLCYDGVFMQIFQPLEPEDFALIKGKEVSKENLMSFCSKFDKYEQASCLTESWPLFFNELSKPGGIDKFCEKTSTDFIDRCYAGSVYVMTSQLNFDMEKIKELCSAIKESKRGWCYANAASRFIETDYRNINDSIKLCESTDKESEKERCFEELLLYSTYNFHKGSKEFLDLCNSMPGTWKARCLSGKK